HYLIGGKQMNLSLAVKEMFEGNEMNIYTNENNDVFMTREQIGQALEYKNPRIAMSNLHNRQKKRLDQFSSVIKLRTETGKRENKKSQKLRCLTYTKETKRD